MEDSLLYKSYPQIKTLSDWPQPPCQAACPVQTNARLYINLIAQERYREALDAIMENNPLPSVIGRICAHPCESACRRGQVEQPIAICYLKRFVTEKVGYIGGQPWFKPVPKTKGKKVAVIGSGPSGLTAAHDLARLGYEVVIYERQDNPGGMLRYGILNYRLPEEVLDSDIRNILALGITLKTGVAIGEDIGFLELVKNYDAVLVSVGLSDSRSINIPGIDLEGVFTAIPFLQSVNTRRPMEIGREVIVIGGGNVAIDVARSARRLGGKKVTLVCLESEDEMPAHDWEIEDTREEGIEIKCSWGPDRLVGKDGRVAGLAFKRCNCVFDEQGRFSPKFDEGVTTVFPCDTAILAIGQAGNLKFLDGSGIKLNERRQLVLDPRTMQTSIPSVFASGEIATGPGAAIQAVASGHNVARSINAYLSGMPLETAISVNPVGELPGRIAGIFGKESRHPMPKIETQERIKNFLEVEKGYSEETALKEAQRCLICTAGAQVDMAKCVACLTCVRVCPYDVPVINGDKAYMDPTLCQSCGLCAAQCPASAITVRSTEEQGFEAQLKNKLRDAIDKGIMPVVAVIVCQYGNISVMDKKDVIHNSLSSFVMIRILCPGRLAPADFLRAFELGADRLIVITCDSNGCHFKSGNCQTEKNLDYVKRILQASGIGADKLFVLPLNNENILEKVALKVVGQ